VVLGGGGQVGGVWELSVIKGLADAGVDLSQADLLVGTSAGAVIGAQMGVGRSPGELLAARLAPPSGPGPSPRSTEDTQFFNDTLPMWIPAVVDVNARVVLGQRALQTPHPIPQQAQEAIWRQQYGIIAWPARALKVSAVDVADGSVRWLDNDQGVPIETAVAASTAQPGLQAPIAIGDERYMDGGTAGTHVDTAAGSSVVVAITPFPIPILTDREMDAVRSAGGQVIDIAADTASRAAMGSDLSDRSHFAAAADAGQRQASMAAEEVRKLWNEH
jgi:NTE family protein